jgi:hypothetical protein
LHSCREGEGIPKGTFLGGILLQSAGVLISIVILQGKVFSKVIAYVGSLTYGLDLAQILIGYFAPGLSVTLMAIVGRLYQIGHNDRWTLSLFS